MQGILGSSTLSSWESGSRFLDPRLTFPPFAIGARRSGCWKDGCSHYGQAENSARSLSRPRQRMELKRMAVGVPQSAMPLIEEFLAQVYKEAGLDAKARVLWHCSRTMLSRRQKAQPLFRQSLLAAGCSILSCCAKGGRWPRNFGLTYFFPNLYVGSSHACKERKGRAPISCAIHTKKEKGGHPPAEIGQAVQSLMLEFVCRRSLRRHNSYRSPATGGSQPES